MKIVLISWFLINCCFLYADQVSFLPIGDEKNESLGDKVVGYEFKIMETEVTNELYCYFLNSTKPYNNTGIDFFSPLMEEHFWGGIFKLQDGSYKVKEGYEDYPVIGVTWYGTLYFCNWFEANKKRFEEGVVNYELFDGNIFTKELSYNMDNLENTPAFPVRNKYANYFLPTRNEWIKAAFYIGNNKWKEIGDTINDNYYCSSKGWHELYPHIRKAIEGKSNFWGVKNLTGNLAEWVEDYIDGGYRMALGGSLIRPWYSLKANYQEGDFPDKSISSFGFRLVYIPYIEDEKTKQATTIISIEDKREIVDKGIKFVLVDDINNMGDILYKNKGKVKYKFYIAKYELTNSQYALFLNSVAVKDDPYGLYNENMGNSVLGGIERKGNIGGYQYFVKPNWENKPVVYVGFYDIARYVNWLHFGCPDTGISKLGTTEGNKNFGAYNTENFEKVRFGYSFATENFGKRNDGALFWIPNDNEWYKAAYYDPNRLGKRKYWDYPNRSCTPPSSDEANYLLNNHLSYGAPYYLSDVDNYINAASYFGTLQQGGNVWEWIEDWQNGSVGIRGLRGGSFGYTEFGLHCLNTDPGGINDESYVFGARIARAYDMHGFEKVNDTLLDFLYDKFLQLGLKKIFVGLLVLSFTCMILIFSMLIICVKKRNRI